MVLGSSWKHSRMRSVPQLKKDFLAWCKLMVPRRAPKTLSTPSGGGAGVEVAAPRMTAFAPRSANCDAKESVGGVSRGNRSGKTCWACLGGQVYRGFSEGPRGADTTCLGPKGLPPPNLTRFGLALLGFGRASGTGSAQPHHKDGSIVACQTNSVVPIIIQLRAL